MKNVLAYLTEYKSKKAELDKLDAEVKAMKSVIAEYVLSKVSRDEKGKEYKQSLLWYPRLRQANDEERGQYTFGFDGIHWRGLDEDISFESFEYDDSEPSALQRFFLTHREIHIAEFARSMGLNPTLLRNYINGFKKPSKDREKEIIEHIHKLGKEMLAA